MKTGTLKYQAAAAANVVVCAGPALLIGIIIGANVGSSVVEISDSKTDGDGNVQIYLAGDTLLGDYDINAVFPNGITADLTNQTNVTFIYQPL